MRLDLGYSFQCEQVVDVAPFPCKARRHSFVLLGLLDEIALVQRVPPLEKQIIDPFRPNPIALWRKGAGHRESESQLTVFENSEKLEAISALDYNSIESLQLTAEVRGGEDHLRLICKVPLACRPYQESKSHQQCRVLASKTISTVIDHVMC